MALEGLGLRVRGSGSGVKFFSKSDAIGGKLSMIDTTPISCANKLQHGKQCMF